MRLLTRRKTPTEELKDAAIEALVNALDDDKRAAKPGSRACAPWPPERSSTPPGALRSRVSASCASNCRQTPRTIRRSTWRTRRRGSERTSPRRTRKTKEPEAYEEKTKTEPDEDEDTGENDEGDRGPSGDEQEEPRGDEDSEEPEARREPDDESSSKTPTPLPERKPMRRAARRRRAAEPQATEAEARTTWVSKD